MSMPSAKVIGFYSQPYNKIVCPHKVWQVPKYFLRRWGPYLTPLRFWAVIAARQICYWNGAANCFEAFDGAIANEAHMSKGHYRRIKKEMDESNTALSLFLSKKPVQYHIVNGRTRPKETEYHLRLDTPLTPADVEHLAHLLRTQGIARQANAIATFLQEAAQWSQKQLLAPDLTPYIQTPPAHFKALTVANVVQQVFGRKLAQNEQVLAASEILHRTLTGDIYLGKQYFREKWFKRLGAGPAFLITYLRSLCYLNEESGELRNEIGINRTELAGALGIERTTLHRWMKKLLQTTDQTNPPFLELVNNKRVSGNEVISTYKVSMHEPLTPESWADYQLLLAELKTEDSQDEVALQLQNVIHKKETKSESALQNVIHNDQLFSISQLQNVIHKKEAEPISALQNVIHDTSEEALALQNDHTFTTRSCKMITPQLQNDHIAVAKCVPNKHYKRLFQTLSVEDLSTLTDAAENAFAWKCNNNWASHSIARAATQNNLSYLFDLIGVDNGGPSRQRILSSGLNIEKITAWHLYALQQTGLTKSPVTLTIKRTQAALPPPSDYLQLAQLSWALWRCYACLLVLPPIHREVFISEPSYELWMKKYGRFHPDDLPFGVGQGVAEAMATWLANSDSQLKPSFIEVVSHLAPYKMVWMQIKDELALTMTKATYSKWLALAELIAVDDDNWTIGVVNEYAVDWITHRLNKHTIEPVAAAIYGRSVKIRYVVKANS